MAINLTEEQKEYIKQWYGKCKAQEISKTLDLPLWRIYKANIELGVSKTLNPMLTINKVQDQIILGGILGDGSFKKNGPNYYYRECHAIGEKDYILWKFNKLYSLTTGKTYSVPSRHGYSPQIAIQTINSPSFNYYVNLTRSEVINSLTELGYAIWILDDGWIRKKAKIFDIAVSGGSMTDNELELLVVQGEKLGLYGHIVGVKEKSISFLKRNNKRMKEIMYSFFDPSMDIMIKKINALQC